MPWRCLDARFTPHVPEIMDPSVRLIRRVGLILRGRFLPSE